MMKLIALTCVFLLFETISLSAGKFVPSKVRSSVPANADPLRRQRRYLGLGTQFKLNRRYQKCVAPGDLDGHCKHAIFCPIDVLKTSKNHLEYLCVINQTHIGVCCPDDIPSSKVQGARLIDLPASGLEFGENDKNTGCGLTTMAKSEGSKNQTQRWPWIAALYFKDSSYEQFCGGSLVTDQHVLTAAHCVEGLNPSDIRVRLGEYDFIRLTETRSMDFSLEKMVMHEDFSTLTYENDIAIVKLNKPANFNSYIWPICLPPVNRTFEGEMAIVAGWGQISHGGPTSELLLEASIPVWKQEECVASFAQSITDNVLCAASYEGGMDSCKGDSGGPLVHQLENGRWVVIGVVSWGIGCGNKNKPGVYTRVNYFLPWIIENTSK